MATSTKYTIKIVNNNGVISLRSFELGTWSYDPGTVFATHTQVFQDLQIGTTTAVYTATVYWLAGADPGIATQSIATLTSLATAAVTTTFGAGALTGKQQTAESAYNLGIV